jgi:long-chain acyl-CoA synthetase
MAGYEGVRIFSNICRQEFYARERTAKNNFSSGYQDLDPAFIRFSSGTTGASKGVLLSHKSIIERTDAADEGLKITSKDIVVWVLSMSFHFVVTILLFLRRGAAIVICSNNFPSSMLEAVKGLKPTFIYGSPFHYYLMANSPAFSDDCLSSVRMAVSTAMRLPLETAEKFRSKFGFELAQCYGIIEAGLPFINDSADTTKRCSVGRILSAYQLKLSEPGDNGGKLLIKGKGMFEAYFSPWRKKEDICPDGWFDTGDLAWVDQDGFVYIKGRFKEVINFCGMKVFPQDVEDVINSFSGVEESLVYGQPHVQYGELPYAKIKLKNGAEADFKPVELRKFCYSKLSSYKVPKDFQLVASLPKTASGKIKRG